MHRWVKRVALVTGASAGIGAEISKQLVKEGMVVIGCARNKDRIQKLSEECKKLGYPGSLTAFKCDVTKEDEINKMFEWIECNFQGVDVCVNNAGLAATETLLGNSAYTIARNFLIQEISAEDMRTMLDVNVIALTLISAKAANSMMCRKVDDGHIININSMSGHRLTGGLNFYSATKFAVTALTEGFRRELVSKSRIRVSSISPGMVETEFALRAFGEEKGKEMYASRGKNLLQAQNVVDALIYALSAPENTQVHDILFRPTGELL